jgi:hypothetical protein
MMERGDSVGNRALEGPVVAGSLSNSKRNEPIGSVFPIRLALVHSNLRYMLCGHNGDHL